MKSKPPFTFPVPLGQIPPRGRRFRIAPDESARHAIAEALGIVEVAELSAELLVAPAGVDAYSVRGPLSAVVIQTDIVTLEPVRQDVGESIDLTLVPAEEAARRGPRKVPLLTALAIPEDRDVYRDGKIDLGEIVVEHLALGLDPYPRSPGVEFPGHEEGGVDQEVSPFAALAKLKREGE
jgi:uncharacterized metal-binding protein YceD (DUF177 family)